MIRNRFKSKYKKKKVDKINLWGEICKCYVIQFSVVDSLKMWPGVESIKFE